MKSSLGSSLGKVAAIGVIGLALRGVLRAITRPSKTRGQNRVPEQPHTPTHRHPDDIEFGRPTAGSN